MIHPLVLKHQRNASKKKRENHRLLTSQLSWSPHGTTVIPRMRINQLDIISHAIYWIKVQAIKGKKKIPPDPFSCYSVVLSLTPKSLYTFTSPFSLPLPWLAATHSVARLLCKKACVQTSRQFWPETRILHRLSITVTAIAHSYNKIFFFPSSDSQSYFRFLFFFICMHCIFNPFLPRAASVMILTLGSLENVSLLMSCNCKSVNKNVCGVAWSIVHAVIKYIPAIKYFIIYLNTTSNLRSSEK